MVWIYLVESEDCQSPSTNGSDPSPIARSTPIVRESCSLKWPVEGWDWLPFGTTSKLFHVTNSLEKALILSREAFHARTLALQDMEKAWKESEADCFSRSCAWPKKSSPNSYSWKTSQPFAPEGDFESLEKLPKWGMTVAGVLYPLLPLERYTSAKGGSYLPTPGATEGGPMPPDTHYRPNQRSYNNRTGKHVQVTLRRYVQMWPTPDASARGCRKKIERTSMTIQNGHHFTIQDAVGSGKLNPTWVEWLMGFPKGWTELKPLETQWFLSKLEKLFGSFY